MNKNQLIQSAAAKTGLSQQHVKECLDAVLGIIGDELKNGSEVVVPDFGRLFTARSSARRVKLPDGRWAMIPVKERVKFKAFSNIKNYSFKY